jgi:hypothetical protein
MTEEALQQGAGLTVLRPYPEFLTPQSSLSAPRMISGLM